MIRLGDHSFQSWNNGEFLHEIRGIFAAYSSGQTENCGEDEREKRHYPEVFQLDVGEIGLPG